MTEALPTKSQVWRLGVLPWEGGPHLGACCQPSFNSPRNSLGRRCPFPPSVMAPSHQAYVCILKLFGVLDIECKHQTHLSIHFAPWRHRVVTGLAPVPTSGPFQSPLPPNVTRLRRMPSMHVPWSRTQRRYLCEQYVVFLDLKPFPKTMSYYAFNSTSRVSRRHTL